MLIHIPIWDTRKLDASEPLSHQSHNRAKGEVFLHFHAMNLVTCPLRPQGDHELLTISLQHHIFIDHAHHLYWVISIGGQRYHTTDRSPFVVNFDGTAR